MQHKGRDLRVVVVDDDFMIALIHAELVDQTDRFITVGRASTGAQALTLIAELSPDLVLLDIHLPDMNGLAVLRSLRERGDDVDAIVVTAERDSEYVKAALRGGASQYLIKPFDLDDLKARIQSYAEKRITSGRIDQQGIDATFAHASIGRTAKRSQAPKGLSPESIDLVETALANGQALSASACAELTGMARVTVRRYLEYFVDSGRASVRLKYGGGRPERLYQSSDALPR